MVTKRVHIESLRIKLPKSMRGQARSAASVIGHDVARTIANTVGGQTGNIRMREISVGRVQDISVVGEKAANKINEVLKEPRRK
jgi:hypothetical protein